MTFVHHLVELIGWLSILFAAFVALLTFTWSKPRRPRGFVIEERP
jgi:hypothetical protein